MTRKDIPNLISILRILLVAPVVMLLAAEHYLGALTLFFVAGASDALDGFLAKRFGWQSRFGSILDPIADKLLLISAYSMLGWQGLMPLWLVAAIFTRDLIIVVGATAFHFFIGQYTMEPTNLSKVNTLAQIVLVLLVMSAQTIPAVPPGALAAMGLLVFFTTVLSGMTYIAVWGLRAWRAVARNGQGRA